MENEETYHYDFTTASELEIFIARIEEIIREWRLPQKPKEKRLRARDFLLKEWCMASEKINFAEVEFQLVRYYLKCEAVEDGIEIGDGREGRSNAEDGSFSQSLDDMLSMTNDFWPISVPPSKCFHPIARWYGLRDFVVLIPHLSIIISSESQIKLFLSSLCIATSNTACQVPFFIQVKEPWRCYFLGVCQSNGFHTDFEMIHVKHIPLYCQYLTGLLHLFKSKIGVGFVTNPVNVTVRFTYVLKDWTFSTWTQSPPDFEILDGESIGVLELSQLPFGAVYEPILGLNLYTTWPHLLENMIVDSESYSDLDPLQAPVWSASVSIGEPVSCLLTEYLTEFVVLNNNTNTMYELLGNVIDSSNLKSNDITSSLSAITESKISMFSKVVIGSEKSFKKQSRHVEQYEGPLSTDILMTLLYYLFPDADAASKLPYPEQYFGVPTASTEENKWSHSTMDPRLRGMKSAPYDSLPWRLAIVMAHVVHSYGGLPSAAYLWYEFTQELRFRCENSILIPGLEFTYPDPRSCLLNQKLQLLNCCISRRIEREKQAEKGNDDSDSDEEFYDCSSDASTPQEENRKKKAPPVKPAGRLAKHDELCLLETGDFLYIPKTQDPIPKTEDQLDEDAQVLVELGADAHGSELRARLMSASLLSDMEAFKAANPGCVLGDFIRWYSPRDWIQDEGVDEHGQPKGHLSDRMRIPGNTWLEVWETAQPVPIKRQRRLFDDTKESEKVLDFFDQQSPKGFTELLLPVLATCVIQKVIEMSAPHELDGLADTIMKMIGKTERLLRFYAISGDRYNDLINDVYTVESAVAKIQSLKQKFVVEEEREEVRAEQKEFVKTLFAGAEAIVPGGPSTSLRCVIYRNFSEASKIEQMKPDQTSVLTDQKWNVISPFQSPAEKEMILRCSTSKGPQRMHFVMKKNEFRLCGAFTKDNAFF